MPQVAQLMTVEPLEFASPASFLHLSHMLNAFPHKHLPTLFLHPAVIGTWTVLRLWFPIQRRWLYPHTKASRPLSSHLSIYWFSLCLGPEILEILNCSLLIGHTKAEQRDACPLPRLWKLWASPRPQRFPAQLCFRHGSLPATMDSPIRPLYSQKSTSLFLLSHVWISLSYSHLKICKKSDFVSRTSLPHVLQAHFPSTAFQVRFRGKPISLLRGKVQRDESRDVYPGMQGSQSTRSIQITSLDDNLPWT